ncbi:hypothetical protein LJC61_02490 [Ruminococcaceae bacterium OttesenSCG-928-A16]|nr:hypothetical protein [Ruminococcaceae bacterium OttesenSCG-928-A16]
MLSPIQQKYCAVLQPLFAVYEETLTPATAAQLSVFKKAAASAGLPANVIAELAEFYEVSNGVEPCLNGFSFHQCNDALLWEWWDDKQQDLWLGSCDDDVLYWQNGQFYFGDVGDVNTSDKQGYSSLLDMLHAGFEFWNLV